MSYKQYLIIVCFTSIFHYSLGMNIKTIQKRGIHTKITKQRKKSKQQTLLKEMHHILKENNNLLRQQNVEFKKLETLERIINQNSGQFGFLEAIRKENDEVKSLLAAVFIHNAISLRATLMATVTENHIYKYFPLTTRGKIKEIYKHVDVFTSLHNIILSDTMQTLPQKDVVEALKLLEKIDIKFIKNE